MFIAQQHISQWTSGEAFWNCSCASFGRECIGVKVKPTRKTAHLLRGGHCLAIFKASQNDAGRHICAQILRSGTAAAANYGEARGAESRADFVHKLRIALKELNETTIWLEVIAESALHPGEAISGIVAENRELCRIIAASIKTATMSE